MQQQRQSHPNTTRLVPLPNYDVTELKLENGQLAMHGLGGFLPTAQAKPIWGQAVDTLESIVHQATHHEPTSVCRDKIRPNINSMVASSAGTWTDDTVHVPVMQGWTGKSNRPESDFYGNNLSSGTTSNVHEEHGDPSSTCASPSGSARLRKDNEASIATWASFESAQHSLKTKSTDNDSVWRLENQDDGPDSTKDGESGRPRSSRPKRAAAVHNQSERKRRDRINQKLKALQRLVPNASKTDKASMLDEVIKYLEQLQAQVQMISSLRNMSHMNMNMMMPLGMQQQQQQQQHLHQMSIMARMGMGNVGLGMGMLDMSNMARHHQSLPPLVHSTPAVAVAAAPTFIPPFMVPPFMPPHPHSQAKPTCTNASSDSSQDPYSALLAQQSMNMDLFNRMAALYRHQLNQTTVAATNSTSQSNHVRRS